jgi:hypothetical protein
MLTASFTRFHCGLGHATRLILGLFEKNDTIIGIGNSALRISSKDPRSKDTIAATIIYLETHIWQFKFLWDLLTLMVVLLIILLLLRRWWCRKLDDLFKSLQRPFLNLVESVMSYLRIFQIKCPKHELSRMLKPYSFASERLQFYLE